MSDGKVRCGEQVLHDQGKREITKSLHSISKVSRCILSLFDIRAVSLLSVLVYIQMFIFASMLGVERYSCCQLGNMLKLAYNVLKYPHPSCGF